MTTITIGAKADLLALAQIQFVKSKTARVFWENGFKSVGAVAAADVKDIMPVLLLVSSYIVRNPKIVDGHHDLTLYGIGTTQEITNG